jgi:hypothetical protein
MENPARLKNKTNVGLPLKRVENIRVCLIEVRANDGSRDARTMFLEEIKYRVPLRPESVRASFVLLDISFKGLSP